MPKKTSPSPTETLPPLYAGWIDELLKDGIPKETIATCENCYMCAESTGAAKNALEDNDAFNKETKCCTYMPEIYNFLVGRILADPETSPHGKKSLQARIQNKIAVSPFGLRRPPVYENLYTKGATSFGKSATLKCPHLIDEGQQCGIWKNRDSVCSTFFCIHVRGETGREFWNDYLKLFLKSIEKNLAIWCVMQINPGPTAQHLLLKSLSPMSESSAYWDAVGKTLTSDELANKTNPENYKQIWGAWIEREEEFYRECGRLVSELTFQKVLEIGGAETKALAKLVKGAYENLISNKSPRALRTSSFTVLSINRETAIVKSPGYLRALEIPISLFNLLPRFDGRPLKDVLETIKTEDNVDIDMDLVMRLWDFRILNTA